MTLLIIPILLKTAKKYRYRKVKKALNSTFLSHKIFCSKIINDEIFYEKQDMVVGFKKIQNINSFIKDFVRPFDLSKDRLYRFCLCEC